LPFDDHPRPVPPTSHERLAFALMAITPALFSSNMMIAKLADHLFAPVALAFWRWTITLLILLPFTFAILWAQRRDIAREWLDLLILGALGMGVCGAFVYIGAETTSVTNIGLIYGASPVLIIVLARFIYGEAMSGRQALGVVFAFVGVVAIVTRADFTVLRQLQFTAGDLWSVAASAGWAVYSVMVQHRPTRLPPFSRFAASIAGGVLIMLPFTVVEGLTRGTPIVNWEAAGWILFLALIPSIASFQSYAFIQRQLGANRAALLMYLVPIYNAVMAALIVGEKLELHHVIGAALILPGMWLATHRPVARAS
jgi:drug/metabolite transporter (DMT)-like permease